MLDEGGDSYFVIIDNNDTIRMNTSYSVDEERSLLANKSFKIGLIVFYILIFFSTFVGNLIVILVVVLQKKMRNSTNFFFTNLAFSDLCVGLFCIFQDLSSFLQPAWPFGQIMCKMYYFTQTMSYTASIFTMVIISIERYIAICYPIRAKKVLQMRNFRLSIAMVWLLSAIICAPNLWMYGVIGVPNRFGGIDDICILQKLLYNTRFFNVINALLLFLFPMILMSCLYIRLGLKLRYRRFETPTNISTTTIDIPPGPSGMSNGTTIHDHGKEANPVSRSRSLSSSPLDIKKQRKFGDLYNKCNRQPVADQLANTIVTHQNFTATKCLWKKKDDYLDDFREEFARSLGCANYSNQSGRHAKKSTVINARRRVIRLLVVVVLTFAFCHFPIHLRKLIQDWYSGYQESSVEGRLAHIITNMLMYINSGINPILYALLSSKFRKSLRGLC